MNETTCLVLLSRADVALMEADTVMKLKELKDVALTARDWLERRNASKDVVLKAQGIALEAERRMGGMLKETERAKAGRPPKSVTARNQLSDTPTLKELGLTKRESAEAQCLAEIPAAEFERVREGEQTKAKAIRRIRKHTKRESLKTTVWPDGKYRVFYADPPWSYKDSRTGTPESGSAEAQYPLMSTEQICALKDKVQPRTLKDCVLFLWVTSPLLPDGLEVIRAWGFSYKASFVWDKLVGFNGHYNDVMHELLLVAVKGSCVPEVDQLEPSILHVKKGKHSRKPAEFRSMIERLYPSGKRLELFSRENVPGWNAMGNET